MVEEQHEELVTVQHEELVTVDDLTLMIVEGTPAQLFAPGIQTVSRSFGGDATHVSVSERGLRMPRLAVYAFQALSHPPPDPVALGLAKAPEKSISQTCLRLLYLEYVKKIEHK